MNSREHNRAARAKRLAAWASNKAKPVTGPETVKQEAKEVITPKNPPKLSPLGYIGSYKDEPVVSVDETTGALTPAYQEAQ